MSTATINLHIVRNGLTHDSRVLKETRTLRDCGLFGAVEIAAFEQTGLLERENLEGRRVWRVGLKSRKLPRDLLSQSLKYAEWRHRIVSAYRAHPLAVIHCHDLEPLPIAVRLKQLTGATLVYDAHELETERTHLVGLRKMLAQVQEKRCMKHVDAMITVSPSIRDWYRQRFPAIPVALVRNVPECPSGGALVPANLRARFNVPDTVLLFIFQGGHGHGRSIEAILAAFAGTGVQHHVIFMGDGVLAEKVRQASTQCERIHWHAPVPPDAVLSMTAGADVGLSLIEDISLSYRYCLPNKLFEYWQAGIPVLASALPDQARLVNQYQAGWTVSLDQAELAATLGAMSRAGVEAARAGVARVNREISWNSESAQLVALYREALHTHRKRIAS